MIAIEPGNIVLVASNFLPFWQLKIKAIRYFNSENEGYLNEKVKSIDIATTMKKIEDAWKSPDTVHSIDAKFYDQIEEAYRFNGLFGMVIYVTETKQKEVGIRKVFGDGEARLVTP